jgi:hypothetical protein
LAPIEGRANIPLLLTIILKAKNKTAQAMRVDINDIMIFSLMEEFVLYIITEMRDISAIVQYNGKTSFIDHFCREKFSILNFSFFANKNPVTANIITIFVIM